MNKCGYCTNTARANAESAARCSRRSTRLRSATAEAAWTRSLLRIMKSLWARELGGSLTPLPEARGGSLVLGDDVVLSKLPIKPLDAYRGMRFHYLDISGTRASCLDDFGGDDETLAGVIKLYAGRCLLTSLRGLERFTSLRYLYLDQNQLASVEWTSVFRTDGTVRSHSLFAADDEGASATAWSPQHLLVIDLQGNPVTERVGWDAPLCGLPQLEWLNGTRWTDARKAAAVETAAQCRPSGGAVA